MPVDIVDEYDGTALMKAAYHNRTDVVRYLLKKRANVDKQNRDSRVALHYACLYNSTDVIKILVQHGARTDIKDKAGNTTNDLARNRNYEEAVGLLQQY